MIEGAIVCGVLALIAVAMVIATLWGKP